MSRFSDLFVAICIVVIATSVGVVLIFQFDLPALSATAAIMLLAFMLLLINFRAVRRMDRSAATSEIDRLTKRFDQLTADLDSMERRVTAIETGSSRRSRQDVEPLVAEVEVIGALIRQVVETVADLEARIVSQPIAREPAAAAAGSRPVQRAAAAQAIIPRPAGLVPRRFEHLGEAGYLALLRSAVDAGRIDVHLQPIVTLPQRKIRYYEALTRLRTADGETIYPADFIPLCEKSGLMPALDQQILLRVIQMVRRLVQRTREIGIFCNLSATSLGDGEIFAQMLAMLRENAALADELYLEFPQKSLKALSAIEFEGLRAIQGIGFKFSVDQIEDLRSSFQFLSDRGFKFAKIPVTKLLEGGRDLATDIHAADLAHYFSRFGIELIADRIERESEVVDVLDYSIKYGQGNLFSSPRPVRTDVAAANSDTAVPAEARDAAAPVAPAAAGRAAVQVPRPVPPLRAVAKGAPTSRPTPLPLPGGPASSPEAVARSGPPRPSERKTIAGT